MAIIDCPSCQKKISDKASSCQHCDLELNSLDNEKIIALKKANKLKKSQRLMNYSFMAMLLFCGGILWLFYRDLTVNSIEYKAAVTATVLGFIWYIVIRVRLVFLKSSK
jgi:hypothetical protein